MQHWRALGREVGATLVASLGRFPVAVVALALFAIRVNLEIAEIIASNDDQLRRAAATLVGAAAIATATVLFCERRGIAAVPRHLLSLFLAAIAGAALWYWDRLSIAFPALFVAAFLAIPLAPYVRVEPNGFWAFVWRLVHAAALSFIAVIVFCLGLSAIFASTDYLFGVDIGSSLYGHIWAIGLGFVGPIFALSLIPGAFPERDAPDGGDIFVTGLRLLSDFVIVPLLAVYVAVLHVYAVKILVEGELPKGQIGWMVLTFGFAALALRIAVHPLARLSRMPTRAFLRWWSVGLVVPLILLVIALWQRVEAYGVTPQRYALGLFGVFLAAVLVTQLFPRFRDDVRVVPALAVLALLLASSGPWGMFPVSARSQMDRLMSHLADAGAIENGVLSETSRFSRDDIIEIRSIVDVLSLTHQLGRLRPLFAGSTVDPFDTPLPERSSERRERIWAALHIDEWPAFDDDGTFTIFGGPSANELIGYDLVFSDLSVSNPQPLPPNPDSASIQIAEMPGARRSIEAMVRGEPLKVMTQGSTIEIAGPRRSLTIADALLRDAVAERLATVEKQGPQGARPKLFIEIAPRGTKVGLLFSTLSGRLTESEFSIYGGVFDLYLRRSDWEGSGGEAPRLSEP